MSYYYIRCLVFLLVLVPMNSIFSDDIEVIKININDHKFYPDKIEITNDQKIRLMICNNDSTVEEFDSIDLKREKIIPPNSCIYIRLGNLKVGTYKFQGEFHADTAKGEIIVNKLYY